MDDPLWTWPLEQAATEAVPVRGSAQDYLATWREVTDRFLPPGATDREGALQRLDRHLAAVTRCPDGERDHVTADDAPQLPGALYQDAVALFMTCIEALSDGVRGSGPVGKQRRRRGAGSGIVTLHVSVQQPLGYLYPVDDYDVDPVPFLDQLRQLCRLEAGLVALRRLCLRRGAAPEDLKPVWPDLAREDGLEIGVYASGQPATSITWSAEQFRAAGLAAELRDARRLPEHLVWLRVQVEKSGSVEHERVRLAGEPPELGGWDPGRALALGRYGDGDSWVGDVLIPRTGPDEQWPAKYVSRLPEHVWEPRENRVIRTDAARSVSGITLLVLDDKWGR